MAKSTSATKSKSKRAPAKTKAKSGGAVTGIHALKEDNPWGVYYDGHERRKNSELYNKTRPLLIKIAESTTKDTGSGVVAWYYGNEPWEDHHGGGLWGHGKSGWFYVRNYAGMEWASQFCADPAKVEILRRNAQKFYEGFPESEAEILKLSPGYPFKEILGSEIKAAADIDRWTDSIFNASVPLPKLRHTGTAPKGHGVHHYPTPVWDIELFKRDDFTLWVTDGQDQPAAVVPVHPRGAAPETAATTGKGKVKDIYANTALVYATPGTKLHKQWLDARANKKTLIAGPDHPLTKQAFKKQKGK